jgi:hypothetical protein
MKKKEERRRRRKEKQRRQNKKYVIYFLFYPLSFIIFFSVLPAIYKREQDREKLRKNFFFLWLSHGWGVAQIQSLARLTPGPALLIGSQQKFKNTNVLNTRPI